METLYVELGERSYPIHIGPGLLSRLPSLLAECDIAPDHPLFIVTDEHVNQRYGGDVQQFLEDAGYKVGKSVVPPGDTSKSLHVLERLVTDALHFGLDRNGVVLALGGGMIGDLAGFLAASYMRGVRFVQLPTTLLAHDSSVGGKVAVNHPLAKNVIGAFHQPAGVIYDTTTLASLPKRELTSGFAEVIKHGLIRDVTLLELLKEKRDQLVGLESPYIDRAILKGCRIKAEVVSRDEKEHGLRAVLNYGHTIGHAVEALADFGRLTHGESIAIGMVGEAMIGERLGTVKEDIVTPTKELLRAYGLPTTLPPYLAETDILARMYHDKKNRSGKLVMVLPTGWGQVDIFPNIPDDTVLDVLRQLKDE